MSEVDATFWKMKVGDFFLHIDDTMSKIKSVLIRKANTISTLSAALAYLCENVVIKQNKVFSVRFFSRLHE